MPDVFKMGSYGAYVWSCYGLTLLALAGLAIITQRSWRMQLQHARRRAQAAGGAQKRVLDAPLNQAEQPS